MKTRKHRLKDGRIVCVVRVAFVDKPKENTDTSRHAERWIDLLAIYLEMDFNREFMMRTLQCSCSCQSQEH